MNTLVYDRTSDDELKLAIRVIQNRINALLKPDQDDLKELFVEFAAAMSDNDDERVEAAQKAIEEILNGAPTRVVVMEVPTASDRFRKWTDQIGKRIRELRGVTGLTQEQLAEKTGITQSYISRLEQGQHSPNALTLEKIAKALGVPLSKVDPTASNQEHSE